VRGDHGAANGKGEREREREMMKESAET